MSALATWYTHCGSTQHGMMVTWDSDDSVNIQMTLTQWLLADVMIYAEDERFKYQQNGGGAMYEVSATATAGTDWVDTNSELPTVQWLVILVNENADCTSAMVCKDAILVEVDQKATISNSDGSSAYIPIDPTSTSDPTNFVANIRTVNGDGSVFIMDQTVSSGYTTIAATVETVSSISDDTENLCKRYWYFSGTSARGTVS